MTCILYKRVTIGHAKPPTTDLSVFQQNKDNVRDLTVLTNAQPQLLDACSLNLRCLSSLTVHQCSYNYQKNTWYGWLLSMIEKNPMINQFTLNVDSNVSQRPFQDCNILSRIRNLHHLTIINDHYHIAGRYHLFESILNLKTHLQSLHYSMCSDTMPYDGHRKNYNALIDNIDAAITVDTLTVIDPHGHHEAILLKRCITLANYSSLFPTHRYHRHSELITRALTQPRPHLDSLHLSEFHDERLSEDTKTLLSTILDNCSTDKGLSTFNISRSNSIEAETIQNLVHRHSTSLRSLSICSGSYISPIYLPLLMSSFPNLKSLTLTICCANVWDEVVLDNQWTCSKLNSLYIKVGSSHRMTMVRAILLTKMKSVSTSPISDTLQRRLWSRIANMKSLRNLTVASDAYPPYLLRFLPVDAECICRMQNLQQFQLSLNLYTENSDSIKILQNLQRDVQVFKDE